MTPHEKELCANCGIRYGDHGGADNPFRPYACPVSEAFPRYPKIKDKTRADKLFDERIEKYWTTRGTAFRRRGS